jgi:hypothetical protein
MQPGSHRSNRFRFDELVGASKDALRHFIRDELWERRSPLIVEA